MQVRRGLALAGAGVVLVAAVPTFAGATGTIKDVLVINKGEQQAIPTKATGETPVSGTVDVGNLPATQQVAGSVSVANLPQVQPVRDADAPHAQPFAGGTEGSNTVAIEDGDFNATDAFPVPDEKRFVAQHVAGAIDLPAGQVPHLTTIEFRLAGQTRRVEVLAQQVSATPNVWKFSHPISLYADPSTDVRFDVNRFPSSTEAGRFRWSIVGYLVDAP